MVNHAVLNAQALHVLTANIQNELNAWKHFLRAAEMRNRFDLAGIHTQSFEQQRLTVAGNRNMSDVHLGLARFIDRKLLIQLGNGTLRAPQNVAFVVDIAAPQKAAIFADKGTLECGRTSVDAKKSSPFIG